MEQSDQLKQISDDVRALLKEIRALREEVTTPLLAVGTLPSAIVRHPTNKDEAINGSEAA